MPNAAGRGIRCFRDIEVRFELIEHHLEQWGLQMEAMPYGSRWPQLAKLWDAATITNSAEVTAVAKRLVAAKARYQGVETKTGVPWCMVAVIHQREASQNFNTQLAQGDPLN